MLPYAGVVAYAVARSRELDGLVAAIGGLGGVVLAAVLARGPLELLPWALLLGGGAYGVSIADVGGPVDGAAALVAAGLLLCAELAAWSLDERPGIAAEPAVVRRRAVATALLAAGGLAAATAVVAVAAAPAGRGLAWTTAGAAAAVAAVGLAVALARRPPG